VDGTTWMPPWGQERIRGMIAERPDWCISRQRAWGIPIPALYCADCGRELLDGRIVARARELVGQHGADIWFTTPIEDLAPPGTTCPQCDGARFTRERDIFDVWFESGASHGAVLSTRPELRWPADLYLEGHDQYRGWFQVSLWNSLITRGRAPYETVLTTGFVLDASGRKMSKRLGNAIDPQEVVKELGAEILRLWVSYVDFKEDMPTGRDIFDQVVDGYRRLRNTLRFMLANLTCEAARRAGRRDFSPDTDALPRERMREVDRWILHRMARLVARLTQAYEAFEFHQVYYRVHEFCAVDLSQIYLDLLKDRLYTYPLASEARRSAQTALWVLASTLARVLAPILTHTMEEVWQHLPEWQGKARTIQISDWPDPAQWRDEELGERWEREVVPYFAEADLAVEELRQRGVARQPLDAELVVYSAAERWEALLRALGEDELAAAAGVSRVSYGGPLEAVPEEGPEARGQRREARALWRIVARAAQAPKCARCWRRQETVGRDAGHPALCGRCVEYLHQRGWQGLGGEPGLSGDRSR